MSTFEPTYGIRDMSEIVIRSGGNTYVGELAQRFVTELPLPKLDASEQFHVLEVMPDNSVVHRASQSTFRQAASYMAPDRVMVYRVATPGIATPDERQALIAGGWEPYPSPVDSYWHHRDGETCVLEYDLVESMREAVERAYNPQPDYKDLWDAYVAGALDARRNPTANEHHFNLAADAYCKLLHSQKAPEMFTALGQGPEAGSAEPDERRAS